MRLCSWCFVLLFVRCYINLGCANKIGFPRTQLCPLWSSSGPWFLAEWGLSVLGIGFLASAKPVLPVFCSVLHIFAFSFLPYFPHSHRGHRGHLYAGSNSETFWILFTLLFEQRSHVTQADLKLYVNWGWPPASHPPAYTSQVLGFGCRPPLPVYIASCMLGKHYQLSYSLGLLIIL